MKKVPVDSNSAARVFTFGRRRNIPSQAIALCLGVMCSPVLFSQAAAVDAETTSPLIRRYREGEVIAYKMQAINQDHMSTVRYTAHAEGEVKRDASGRFTENIAWTSLSINGQALSLSKASQDFREDLSLSPEYKLSIPNLSNVQPGLIGPTLDLLTFYADMQLAMKQKQLVRGGDHVYVKHGTPNSWADGMHTTFGQDAVDFDITLSQVDKKSQVLTLLVRHVPPTQSRISFPAAWMKIPAYEQVNNWAQVQKDDNGKYLAQVGRESFDDTIKISLRSGQIISAVMQNPVDVMARECDDASLSSCSAPVRYRINRHIVIEEVKH